MNAKEILSAFEIEGTPVDANGYGEGHINSTFLAETKTAGGVKKYVLQRINTNLFTDPEKLMNNILLVTEHIKSRSQSGKGFFKDNLTIIPTKDGKLFKRTEDGCYRVYAYIDGVSYQVVEDPRDFYRCARAFGGFAESLKDFNANLLYESIPHFHDTEKRFRDFTQALGRNASGRAEDCRKEIDFVLERKDYCGVITSLLKSGEIPTKVTHNDTKLNNVMFDGKTGEVLAVIDLDTVMPGSICYDFGDAIRFGCNTSSEDDKDLNNVNFDIELFRAFTEGYFSAIGDGITQTEADNLAFSSVLMTYECGMRFLADHLDGDVYFHTSRKGHNLDRARTQFKLISDMEKALPQMREIVSAAQKKFAF